MKEYDINDFKSKDHFRDRYLKDLSYLIGKQTTYKDGSVGTITKLTSSLNEKQMAERVIVEITFDSEVKKCDLFAGVKSGTISLDKEDEEFITYLGQTITSFGPLIENRRLVHDRERVEANKQLQAIDAEREKEKKVREAEEKRKLKFEQNKTNLIERANRLSEIKLDKLNDYYVSLGYITKHVKKISAVMPDYLDDWFKNNFGDQEHKLVDSNKITSGGFSYQWSLGMTVDLDTNDNIPDYLIDYLGQTKKTIQPISNTEFIFGLMKDSGLAFGKKQDTDKVLENVPQDYLASFNYGYSL